MVSRDLRKGVAPDGAHVLAVHGHAEDAVACRRLNGNGDAALIRHIDATAGGNAAAGAGQSGDDVLACGVGLDVDEEGSGLALVGHGDILVAQLGAVVGQHTRGNIQCFGAAIVIGHQDLGASGIHCHGLAILVLDIVLDAGLFRDLDLSHRTGGRRECLRVDIVAAALKLVFVADGNQVAVLSEGRLGVVVDGGIADHRNDLDLGDSILVGPRNSLLDPPLVQVIRQRDNGVVRPHIVRLPRRARFMVGDGKNLAADGPCALIHHRQQFLDILVRVVRDISGEALVALDIVGIHHSLVAGGPGIGHLSEVLHLFQELGVGSTVGNVAPLCVPGGVHIAVLRLHGIGAIYIGILAHGCQILRRNAHRIGIGNYRLGKAHHIAAVPQSILIHHLNGAVQCLDSAILDLMM